MSANHKELLNRAARTREARPQLLVIVYAWYWYLDVKSDNIDRFDNGKRKNKKISSETEIGGSNQFYSWKWK
jgi:hypothetical protein